MRACALLALLAGCAAPAPPARVVVVGIDGGDWDVLDPLLAAGELPNLQRVKAEGAWARLDIDSPNSPVSWTSLATGRHPAGHGVVLPEGMAAPKVSQALVRTRRLWDLAGARGRRSLVAHWWLTWPAYPVEGVLLARACPACGGQESGAGAAWPEGADARAGQALDPGAHGEALLRLGLWDERLGAAAQGWMQAEDFDLTLLPYYSLDQALHMLYAEHAESLAQPGRRGWHTEGAALVLQCARMADELLGRALAEAGPEGYVVVVSDHGHAGHALGTRRLAWSRAWLGLEGPGTVGEGRYTLGDTTLIVQEEQARGEGSRPAYMLRLPVLRAEGPGAAALLARLEATGLAERRGDALLPAAAVRESARRVVGQLETTTHTVYVNSGYHDQSEQGIFALLGPEVAPGPLGTVRTVDLAPTVLWLMDLPVGEDLDGQPLTAALTPAGQDRRPVERLPTLEAGPLPWADAEAPELDPAEQERLRALS